VEEDIIGIVLRAENDYQFAINSAVEKAEKYADDSRKDQSAYLEKLRLDFDMFESEQSSSFEETLRDNMRKMDEDNILLKEQLTACFSNKVETVSERLMKEVLLVHGDS